MKFYRYSLYLAILIILIICKKDLRAEEKDSHKLGFGVSLGSFFALDAEYKGEWLLGFLGSTDQKDISVFYQYFKYSIKLSYSEKEYSQRLTDFYSYPYFLYLDVAKHSIKLNNYSVGLYYDLKHVYFGTAIDIYKIEERMENIHVDYFEQIEGIYRLNYIEGFHFDGGISYPIKLSLLFFT